MFDADGRIARLLLIVFDLLIGLIKLAAILAPLWLPLLMIFGDSGCKGDCGVGMGMLFIALLGVAVAFGPILLLVGVPLVAFLLHRWTRGRPVQFVSGVSIIPLLVIGVLAYNGIREHIRSSEFQAAMRPEYLSRTFAKPVGKLEHLIIPLVIPNEDGLCGRNCYEVLVNGFASKYSQGYLDERQGDGILDRVYTLATGAACASENRDLVKNIEGLQSFGLFDLCIVESRPNATLTATLLRGVNWDKVQRPHGLYYAKVLQAVKGAELGGELIRWEHGFVPWKQGAIGTQFAWQDLVRAYTGIPSDRFGDAQKLNHGQRLGAILSASGMPLLQLRPVFGYLRDEPYAMAFRSAAPGEALRKLSGDDITKLRTIGMRICAATPIVKDNKGQSRNCLATYNELVRDNYPGQASALLPTPQ